MLKHKYVTQIFYAEIFYARLRKFLGIDSYKIGYRVFPRILLNWNFSSPQAS